jgi:hypothetical protein
VSLTRSVRVLILVDEHMVEALADLAVADHLRPVAQQIVVIEDILSLLRLDIDSEQLLQFGGPDGAPREGRSQHTLDRQLGVDASRIDGETSAFGRKLLFRLREP